MATSASAFQPPPTYADVVLVDDRTKRSQFNPLWLDWFLRLAAFVSQTGGTNNVLQGGTLGQVLTATGSAYAVWSSNFNSPSGTITAASASLSGSATASSLKGTGTGGVGYATGAGGAVTQTGGRTGAVTLNKTCGQITLASAAGQAAWQTFTVNNNTVAATDVIVVNVASSTNDYAVRVSAVAAGSFNLAVSAVSGTATDTPVLNFAVMKAVTA